jgi:thiol-disulfide isomerase/thioredoxin
MDTMNNMEPVKKSSSAVIAVVAVLVLVGIGALAFSGPSTKDKAMMMEKEAMMKQEAMEKEAMMMKEKESMQKDAMMKDGDAMMKKEGSMTEKEAMMKKDGAMMMSKGSYESYSPEKLAWAKDGKVVIFFKASWCPTCRSVDADIKSNLSSIPKGTHILEVDYDKSSDLKSKYGVTIQHTFVQVDSNGNKLAKWSGSPTLNELVKNIK